MNYPPIIDTLFLLNYSLIIETFFLFFPLLLPFIYIFYNIKRRSDKIDKMPFGEARRNVPEVKYARLKLGLCVVGGWVLIFFLHLLWSLIKEWPMFFLFVFFISFIGIIKVKQNREWTVNSETTRLNKKTKSDERYCRFCGENLSIQKGEELNNKRLGTCGEHSDKLNHEEEFNYCTRCGDKIKPESRIDFLCIWKSCCKSCKNN